MRSPGGLLAAMLLGACATQPQAQPVVAIGSDAVEQADGWRGSITVDDMARLDGLSATWAAARAEAARRSSAAVAAEGDLLEEGAALNHPAPSPGSYHCRLVRMGHFGRRGAAVRSFPSFFCYVRSEGSTELSFTKQTGTDLPGGWLHRDGDRRYVFLGAKQRSPGDTSIGYGTDPERNLVGVVERVGPFRWRLVVPWREGDAGVDIYELVPVPVESQRDEPRPTPEVQDD